MHKPDARRMRSRDLDSHRLGDRDGHARPANHIVAHMDAYTDSIRHASIQTDIDALIAAFANAHGDAHA